jgi:hypothetical protein
LKISTTLKCVFSTLSLLSYSLANAQTIFVKPGQCIQIGSQQVCALAADGQPAAETNPIIESLFQCRLGEYKDSEFPKLKTHALVKTHLYKDGKKIETVLKNFGLHGKAECEKELKEEKAKANY